MKEKKFVKYDEKELITPSEKQIINARTAGWEYLGDGLFANGDQLGWFTSNGFVKD